MKWLFGILGLSCLMGCSTVRSTTTPMNSERCQHTETSFNCVHVVEVYDGDSFFVDLPDQHPLFGRRMGVRIAGIDTPEIKTKNACEKQKAQEAKRVLENLFSKSRRIDLVNVERDKFFRILATVKVDDQPVIDELELT